MLVWLHAKARPLRLYHSYVACGSANADVVRMRYGTGPRNFDAPTV